MRNDKLLIIGLDGATWKVLNPLIDKGKLPNIKSLVDHGVSGELESVFPPVTGPAWLSMATGKNPGKTGVFDFLNRRDETLNSEPVNSQHFINNKTYWDYLSNRGFQVGILNHPMLFPPYKINGFMVAGLGASPEDQFTYPLDLKEELNYATDGYQLAVSWNSPKYHEKKELLIDDLEGILKKKIKGAKYCLNNYELNLALVIFQESDILQHCMWKDWEHPDAAFHKEFIHYWELLDEAIGRVINTVENNTTVMLVSDHGFGLLDENFLINKWLLRNGYLVKKSGFASGLKNMIRTTFKSIKQPIKLAALRFPEKMTTKLKKSLGNELSNMIDRENSTAFAAGYTSSAHGAIYINKYDEKNYESIRQEIVDKLKKYSINRGFTAKCFRTEELYWGKNIRYAPDILFMIDNHRCNIQTNKFVGPIFSNSLPIKNKSGAHRKEGIFVCSGPNIKQSVHISGAKILDIAPTILSLFGFKYPSSMDGRILREIYEEPPNDKAELKPIEESENTGESSDQVEQTTGVEEQEIRDRLRNLGYLD